MVEPRRITIPLGLSVQIHTLAEKYGYNDIDLINLGASLAKMVFEEREKDHKLILTDSDGKPLLQIVPPTPQEMQAMRGGEPQEVAPPERHSLSLLESIADLDPDHPKNKDSRGR